MIELVRFLKQDFIVTITINRPLVRNALSRDVVKALEEAAQRLVHDYETRAVVITGEGNLAFSAGADLKERQTMTEAETLNFVSDIQRAFHLIADLPMPTIAAINGDAFGGGLELALACDLRIMSSMAKVGLTECSWGIIPGAGGTQRLPRIVGLSSAMDMIFSAKRINGDQACAMGLVNHLANDAESARALALELAKKIALNAPLAIRAAKQAILASREKNIHDGLVAELASYHEIVDTMDRKEGLAAFREKRTPVFRGI